jgi:zinc transport system substrate-binding protein
MFLKRTINRKRIHFLLKGRIRTFAIMKKYVTTFLFLVALLSLVSCKEKKVEVSKPQLTVSIIPQKHLVSFIAGNKFEVQAMLPPGSNHETYEPAPRDMEKIANSDFYFILGALDFELTWMERFTSSNPSMKVINTSEGIEMLSGHIHDTDDDHGHEQHGTDPHIWLSPSCMKIQAANICKALSEYDTLNADFYIGNLKKFNQLADSTDQRIREILSGSEGKSILIFHPALGYFVRDFNLTQISIEQEGKEPSPAYLGELVKMAKAKNIRSVFISKEFDTRNAEAIAREINAKIVVFDPMAENWAENMLNLAKLIAEN